LPFNSELKAGLGLIVSFRLAVALAGLGVAESVTWTVKVKLVAVFGVPEITPLLLKLRPAAVNAALFAIMFHEYGGLPNSACKVKPFGEAEFG
jgi:hypothetical protein